jgi:hypothetical protein
MSERTEVNIAFSTETSELVEATRLLREQTKTVKDLRAASAGVGTAQDSVAKSTQNMTNAQREAQKQAAASGRAWQNIGFQLQDVAVQLEGNVAVTKVLAQQLPQMLIGFGAMGAGVGVALSLLPFVVKGFEQLTSEAFRLNSQLTSSVDRFTKLKEATSKPIEIFTKLIAKPEEKDKFSVIMEKAIIAGRLPDLQLAISVQIKNLEEELNKAKRISENASTASGNVWKLWSWWFGNATPEDLKKQVVDTEKELQLAKDRAIISGAVTSTRAEKEAAFARLKAHEDEMDAIRRKYDEIDNREAEAKKKAEERRQENLKNLKYMAGQEIEMRKQVAAYVAKDPIGKVSLHVEELQKFNKLSFESAEIRNRALLEIEKRHAKEVFEAQRTIFLEKFGENAELVKKIGDYAGQTLVHSMDAVIDSIGKAKFSFEDCSGSDS